MIYIATFKGDINSLRYDLQTDREFFDISTGYFKEEIEAENDAQLSEKIADITKGGNCKLIGVTDKQ